MATFLNKVQFLSKKVKPNQVYYWKQQYFHTNRASLNQASFSEKPLWFKKFKQKQAAMQKDDHLPTFLKKGFPDKVLFNVTLYGLIFGLVWAVKVLRSLDIKTPE